MRQILKGPLRAPLVRSDKRSDWFREQYTVTPTGFTWVLIQCGGESYTAPEFGALGGGDLARGRGDAEQSFRVRRVRHERESSLGLAR
jgi:hypothetical protein